MDSKLCLNDNRPRTVKISELLIFFVSFFLGIIALLLYQNYGIKEQVYFSTLSLLGFVLSIMISGASIILAIAAIYLGKFSEKAMIERSDESIRLQNEVFQKTTDALQRIESSTGVTEKRIEDIITGRVGSISEKIANMAFKEDKNLMDIKISEIEEIVKKSLLQGLREESANYRPFSNEDINRYNENKIQEEKENQKNEKIYEEKHNKLLRAFSCRDDLRAIKMHHGSPRKSGEDLFDAIYLTNDNRKIAVSTFRDTDSEYVIRLFAQKALYELKNNNFDYVYVALFKANFDLESAFRDCLEVASSDLRCKIDILKCLDDDFEKQINSLKLMES